MANPQSPIASRVRLGSERSDLLTLRWCRPPNVSALCVIPIRVLSSHCKSPDGRSRSRTGKNWSQEQEGRDARPPTMDLELTSRQRWATLTATTIWGLAVAIGFLALQLHGASPSQRSSAVGRWPSRSRVPRPGGRATLVVAVHPRCPCTRASVSELTRLLTRCEARVEVYILLFCPAHGGRGWGPTEGLRGLGTMPGVHVLDDPGGEEAARFGAQTSGLVALYAQDGRLLFRGGITGARGHEGDNVGRRALIGLIQGNSSSYPRETPVFGCPIFAAPFTPAGSVPPWKR